MWWLTGLNFAAWFIFVFIGVVWLLVLLQHRPELRQRAPVLRRLPFVSILVPAHNEAENIAACVRSLLALDYPKGRREVIVIDDASTDGTAAVAQRYPVRLLRNVRNRGKAFSLNRGLAVARGELVATVDADSVVARDMLQKMVGYFSDARVGSVTPALKAWKPRGLLARIQAAEYLLNVFLRKMLAYLDSIHVTPGVFSLYRTAVLRRLGGFDVGNLTEDMEIALRLHDAGYRIENALDAVSYTLCPTKLSELYRQRVRWYRGALQNTVRYKHMLFNRRFGNLGVFLLPMNLISVVAIIILFAFLVSGWAALAAGTLWRFSLIGWDFSQLFNGFNPLVALGALASTPVLFAAIGLALGGYILRQSFRATEEDGNKLGSLVYLVAFPILLMAFWAAALAAELVRAPRRW